MHTDDSQQTVNVITVNCIQMIHSRLWTLSLWLAYRWFTTDCELHTDDSQQTANVVITIFNVTITVWRMLHLCKVGRLLFIVMSSFQNCPLWKHWLTSVCITLSSPSSDKMKIYLRFYSWEMKPQCVFVVVVFLGGEDMKQVCSTFVLIRTSRICCKVSGASKFDFCVSLMIIMMMKMMMIFTVFFSPLST